MVLRFFCQEAVLKYYFLISIWESKKMVPLRLINYFYFLKQLDIGEIMIGLGFKTYFMRNLFSQLKFHKTMKCEM